MQDNKEENKVLGCGRIDSISLTFSLIEEIFFLSLWLSNK